MKVALLTLSDDVTNFFFFIYFALTLCKINFFLQEMKYFKMKVIYLYFFGYFHLEIFFYFIVKQVETFYFLPAVNPFFPSFMCSFRNKILFSFSLLVSYDAT